MFPITNDAVIIGILLFILAVIFQTQNSERKFWKSFYKYIPALLLCYFVPGIFNSIGIISAENSNLYHVASRYLLPTSLVLFTIGVDFKSILKLGPKAIIMTFTGTLGIILGGPIAIMIVSIISPDIIISTGPDATWRGLSTIAGSWIGGGANQTAMKEVFQVSDTIFSAIIAIDVLTYSVWFAILLYGAGINDKINKWLKADTSSIEAVQKKMEGQVNDQINLSNMNDLLKLLAVGFGVTAIAHFLADIIAPFFQENFPELAKFSLTSNFFWMVILATTGGLILSFTRFRNLEARGASKMGSLFLYVLIATIGMSMEILGFFQNFDLLLITSIWISFHAILLIIVGRLIRAPFFFLAVGSQANIGGAASAPIVAAAIHPNLATVGVLLAVVGYASGTYGAWLCAILMSLVS
ncbi:MAG: DUF819 family protein [Melioribacteraceae bacterium]|nr:DUF819 family protein [Melioribacteraceae bacterium]